jgi:hypothetical protein
MNRKDFDKDFESLLKRHLGSRPNGIETAQHCPDENAVIAYLEGQLPPEVKKSFERHASHCSRCQEELAALLQTEMPLAENSHQASGSIRASRILNGIAATLRNFQIWGFKPALAVLLITIISGYIGYEVYLQKGPASRHELDQLMTRSNESPSARPQSSAELRKDVAQAPGEAPPSKSAEVPSSPAIAAPRLRLGGTAESTGAEHIAQAEKAPETAISTLVGTPGGPTGVSDNEKDTKTEMKILTPEESRKESFAPVIVSEPLPHKQDPQAMAAIQKAGEASTPTRNLAVAGRSAYPESQDNSRALKTNSLKGVTTGQSNSDEAKVTEAAGAPVEFGKRAKGTFSSARAKLDSRETPSLPEGSRLEAGDKIFVLRDHVWNDLSIADADSYNQVFISRNSSNYPELVKPLAAYQKLLSRPEDVLVLHGGKIYRISSRSEPPEKN